MKMLMKTLFFGFHCKIFSIKARSIMNLSYTDIVILGIFVISIFIAGFTNMHKVKNFREFSVGDKNFSLSSLVATLSATYLSGSLFFTTVENTYQRGLYYLFSTSGVYLGIAFSAFYLVPKLTKFLNNISLAESIGQVYGNYVRLIIALSILLSTIGLLAVQFKAFSKIFNYITHIDSIWSLIIPAVILTVYAGLGGIRSVIYTDIIQFIALIIPLALILSLTLKTLFLNEYQDSTNFEFTKTITSETVINVVSLFFFFFLNWSLEPGISHRMFLSNNTQKLKKAILISLVIFVIIRVLLSLLPIMLMNINSNLNSADLFNFMLNEFAHNPGIKGILMVGIIAMSMSTADSWINLASIAFVNDILLPWKFTFFKKYQLLIAKCFSFTLGGFALFFAIQKSSLFSIIQLTSSFYMISAIPVSILTILGFRTHKNNILCAMILGMLFFLLLRDLANRFQLIGDTDSYTIVLSTCFTFVFILFVHYVFRLNGGWSKKDPLTKFIESEKKHRLNDILHFFSKFNFKNEFIKNIPLYPAVYFHLGFYLIIWSIFLAFKAHDNFIMSCIFIMSVILSVLLFAHESIRMRVTQHKFKKYSLIIWNFSLFGLLSLGSSLFFLFGPIDTTSCAIFLVNNLVLFLLTNTRLAYTFTAFSLLAVLTLNFILNQYFILYYQTPAYHYCIEIFLVLIIALVVTFFIKPFYQEIIIKENYKKLLDETERRFDKQYSYIQKLEEQILSKDHK